MSFFDNARRAFSTKLDEYYDDEREYDEEYDDYEEEPKRPLFSFLSRKSEEDYDRYEEDDEVMDEPEAKRYSSTSTRPSYRDRMNASTAKEAPTPSARQNLSGVEVSVHYPVSLDDAMRIIQEVKFNKITIFDVSAISSNDEARRVVDYIGGASYGMDCPFERLCPSIFCIAPKGVKINTKKNGY